VEPQISQGSFCTRHIPWQPLVVQPVMVALAQRTMGARREMTTLVLVLLLLLPSAIQLITAEREIRCKPGECDANPLSQTCRGLWRTTPHAPLEVREQRVNNA
jgi:hypothetical protein